MNFYPLTPEEKEQRVVWSSVRATLEAFRFKYKRSGKKSRSNWTLFERILWFFQLFLKLIGAYSKGLSQAKNILVQEVKVPLKNLPAAFSGFRILHLSDLHIDAIEGLEDIIIQKIKPLQYDLCVITGDFRRDTVGGFQQILPAMKKLVAALHPEYGTLAVLGNHDTFQMVKELEPFGIRFLVNETVFIHKENHNLRVTGVDDTYYYYTDMALHVLEKPSDDFSIALSHTSELCDVAAENGYGLYLCGHTHGGQICLPGGIPIISHQKGRKEQVRGLWYQNGMTGYTSPGAGVSGVPLRFNCPPEITVLELSDAGKSSSSPV